LPVLSELDLVELCPSKHEADLSAGEGAVNRFQGVDPDLGFALRMPGR
jgi:hypothetical protein